ncbi:MAG TPA: GGDEF domain-containing protein [Candidatus Aminicenantes bacterium]|nr:GGDEF domain-containing protein [Candidatus Aminicenantes bacterium]
MTGEMPATPAEPLDPENLAELQIRDKNRWLINLRWVFAGILVLLWGLVSLFPQPGFAHPDQLLLVVALLIMGNLMLLWWLQKPACASGNAYRHLYQLTSLQLDFDLAAIAIVVYLTHPVNNPLWVLFIFHIVVSVFFLVFEKALRNTLAIMFLFTLFVLLSDGLLLSQAQLIRLLLSNLLFLLAFLLSYRTARHAFRKERLFQDLLEKTRELSVADGLTGLFNQTHFFHLLTKQITESRARNRPFSLVIFDVDNFKNYNDRNGHIRGSLALQQLGKIMKRAFRKSDILAKYGGDEFVMILPGTDKVGAYLAAERLRERVEKEVFSGGEFQPQGRVTISLGISSFPEHGDTEDTVLDRADRAMYVSKETGRNRTTIYSSDLENLDLEDV